MMYTIRVSDGVDKVIAKWKKSNPNLFKKYKKIYKELFNLGTLTYLEVLSAQQSYLSAQISQVSDCFDKMQAVVSLYQALGGGRED